MIAVLVITDNPITSQSSGEPIRSEAVNVRMLSSSAKWLGLPSDGEERALPTQNWTPLSSYQSTIDANMEFDQKTMWYVDISADKIK